ncbi:MAG: sigma-70 family RNA polymerase sigma factor [Acidobacteria bacterium]|nr:sigma-70 family RNA polymerase sigma factor [Acidobacteriota bacterium]
MAIDWLRQGREQAEENSLLLNSIIDVKPDAEQRLLANERQRQLRAVMMQLSPQQRHCLFLRAEGLNYREIGEVLGIGISTVATFWDARLSGLLRK